MHEIDLWFKNGCNYESGVEIYNKYGTNTGIKTILSFGSNRYNRSRLKEALAELLEGIPQFIEKHSPTGNEDIDETLRLYYRERASLHANLEHIPSQSDRKKVAFRILSLVDKIERILGVNQHTKEVPVPLIKKSEDLPKDNPVELMKLRNNNRAYISKNQSNPTKSGEVSRRLEENEKIEAILGV